jgi:hypothetical protein
MMTTSAFGAAFDRLPREAQIKIIDQLRIRRMKYTAALYRMYLGNSKVIIIGDKPGPGRPSNPEYHHTPFYSTKHSSLWLNQLLIEANINELDLLWFNAELANGSPLNPIYLQDLAPTNPQIIVLGGNAESWINRHVPEAKYVRVHHPQFMKRFKSKEPYALIDEIKKVL